MEDDQKEVLRLYDLGGRPLSSTPCGSGHIHRSFALQTDSGRRYLLQKINSKVFSDVPGLMKNIEKVTAHLQSKTADSRSVLHLVRASDGASFVHTKSGFWRIYDFVEGSFCLQQTENADILHRCAEGYGSFVQKLSDFDALQLADVIPYFHHTPKRYETFRNTLEKDAFGRACGVQKEIAFFLEREKNAGLLQELLQNGSLPLRVTHNDTKLNNMLFDEKTGKALCVVDLDTVMPGSVLFDFGDAIRSCAALSAEDEPDPSKAGFCMEAYKAFAEGFLLACPSLTETEKEHLADSARIMTLECGLRFLTDYLNGDTYFAADRPRQNLDRSRTHIAMVLDMERQTEAMKAIVKQTECSLSRLCP